MAKRSIIKIDQRKCNGCGQCIPNCPEGAIQIIDNKAYLVSDLFCDGLGACIGHCPQGAITIEEREAGSYDELKVMENIVKQGKNVIIAHLKHLKEHNQKQYLRDALEYLKSKNIHIDEEEFTSQSHNGHAGCPGSRVIDLRARHEKHLQKHTEEKHDSQLRQWPVQLKLVPVTAPYFEDADLLISADCVPFAYPDFHEALLRGKILLVGCPKLDDMQLYSNKIIQILKHNNIKSITYAHMEVPCCFGFLSVIEEAIKESGKDIPFYKINIGIKGDVIQ